MWIGHARHLHQSIQEAQKHTVLRSQVCIVTTYLTLILEVHLSKRLEVRRNPIESKK